MITYGLSLLAGVLSVLSPCVLPILPIVVASAMNKHWIGLVTLALGVAFSFTLLGVGVASAGLAIGLDAVALRYLAAGLMLAAGVFLVSKRLQDWFSTRTAGIGARGHSLLGKLSPEGARGQFVVGLLLGVVWTPCVGPTLGAAIALASQGQNLGEVSGVMSIFSLGAVAPLLLIGLLSRHQWMKRRGDMANIGQTGRTVMGYSLLTLSLLVFTGMDKTVEIWLLGLSPDWMLDLTT